MAFCDGTIKALGPSDADCRVEMGKITSAGAVVSSSTKKVAVKVVLNGAVYVLSIKFPRSKMIFCGSLNSTR